MIGKSQYADDRRCGYRQEARLNEAARAADAMRVRRLNITLPPG